ncbi:ThuA domain-containing protein [bacterium]|uniref:Signal peptide domain-containing protein n=1 Tax=Rubinisphaera brasiliensis (strain ATCC 49424 / DSM 5305 / JCM 21570 / IAM 15109 / NBRC 103401 / IFAM 1448) TaxID=756272 RepID=F0SL73_RUBBR|nr:ThuA domain-containing protein [Rubinisphaera brasiliensis]ADY60956.1 signal peptide domain-containing protein [Rubinisphaera brasiliensis DSM 5305]MBR9800752.1 ThuA domain-containing protein [bacterium]
MRQPVLSLLAVVCGLLFVSSTALADDRWVTYEGQEGPGKGKHILFIAGDEEYRSEEACPMLAQILAKHHGFRCTVLFSQDPETGEIDPENQTNIPGMHLIPSADLVVLFTRFRELPDADMKYFDDYFTSGKPVIGLRTATHGFNYSRNQDSPYRKYTWTHKGPEWKGGFGKEVFGETWYSHHGKHKSESTRGVINAEQKSHPILNGVEDLWGPTDVYGIRGLPEGSTPLVYGQVLEGMEPGDKPVEGKKNDPMMPVAWTREYQQPTGEKNRVFCTTFCSAIDLESEDLRRMLVNGCYWALGMEDEIPKKANVSEVADVEPSFYGFGKYKRGVKPADWAW